MFLTSWDFFGRRNRESPASFASIDHLFFEVSIHRFPQRMSGSIDLEANGANPRSDFEMFARVGYVI